MRYILLFLLGIILYKFFARLVDKKQTPVQGTKTDSDSFQKKYQDLIEDADFEEVDDDDKKE